MTWLSTAIWVVGILVVAAILLPQSVRILREYERGVVFRFGRLRGPAGPGWVWLMPFVDRLVRIDLRIIAINVDKQEAMTYDNVPITVDAVVYFNVIDPVSAVVKVEHYLRTTSYIAQTTLRSVLGESQLDEILSKRDKINKILQEIIDKHTEPWGVKVSAVELKDVVLPEGMKRAMAKQAESERERRAKIINSEGEFQAAEKLVQAAKMISTQPIALQLRYLQSMVEIASEHNTTTFLPIPMELFGPYLRDSAKEFAGAAVAKK